LGDEVQDETRLRRLARPPQDHVAVALARPAHLAEPVDEFTIEP
jgi:hypothetical protein